ncbi:MAG: hypothetical protein U0744_16820 [Gemmataceae bacterium]
MGSSSLLRLKKHGDLGLAGGGAVAVEEDHHDHGPSTRVKLSAQARENLKLTVKPLEVRNYWRTLQVPASIIDRPGYSDRGVTAPVAGVVAKVHAYPGDIVRPGDSLYTVRLVSEYLQNTQSEMFKATQEVKLNDTLLERTQKLFETGAIEQVKVVELQNQARRLRTQLTALRQDLLTRGLTPEQINVASEGKFVNEVVIKTPEPALLAGATTAPPLTEVSSQFAFEVQELKVQLGEQVQAGQLMSVLANHRSLFIEGRAFKKEATLLERAAQNRWPIEAEFTEDAANDWPALDQKLTIRHLSNQIDPASRTFGFFIPLENQARSYMKDGETHLVWRFRPGQRAKHHVPVEEFEDVFVLPTAAVVREGPEAFVFRQNGDAFDRKPVRIEFEDRRHVLIANDGSVFAGSLIAQNSAAALHRVLKSQQSGGGDAHAGHNHSH